MRPVLVRDAHGQDIEMLAVDETDRLVYVIAPSTLERFHAEKTEAVGVPIRDVRERR